MEECLKDGKAREGCVVNLLLYVLYLSVVGAERRRFFFPIPEGGGADRSSPLGYWRIWVREALDRSATMAACSSCMTLMYKVPGLTLKAPSCTCQDNYATTPRETGARGCLFYLAI